MKASFQVIHNGIVIFEAYFEELTPQNLPRSTAVAVEKFNMDHPALSLTDRDVIMKWAEWEEPGSEE